MCDGGAGLHSPGGAEGGAKVAVCEGILRCTQPKDLSLVLSPRYESKAGNPFNTEGFSALLHFGVSPCQKRATSQWVWGLSGRLMAPCGLPEFRLTCGGVEVTNTKPRYLSGLLLFLG